MTPQTFDAAEHGVLAILPARARDFQRLRVLVQERPQPTVTVIGKYNHGKSRLLNELMGSDIFAVADKRATLTLAEQVQGNLRWLDAPGLDADVGGQDDAHADQAADVQADIRLFVHAVKEGELDAAECAVLKTLVADAADTQRATLLVLTQVDQLADDEQVNNVIAAIRAQAPALAPHPVSATRHRQGVTQQKNLLVQASGIPVLRTALHAAIDRVPAARSHESAQRLAAIRQELQERQADAQTRWQALRHTQAQQWRAFEQELSALLDKVQGDLEPVLTVQGNDPALEPDSFANAFKLTAGKQARATIQIAYSRACIAINALLVKHGVVGLPAAQQTSVASLDTVMVAVLGVSVKYREDLRRMFCQPAGRARLSADFARYFEQSEDRQALARQIGEALAQQERVREALAALQSLEASV